MVWKLIGDILACDILTCDFSCFCYFDVNTKKLRFEENKISGYISSVLIFMEAVYL